jgi:hypothetical protein
MPDDVLLAARWAAGFSTVPKPQDGSETDVEG